MVFFILLYFIIFSRRSSFNSDFSRIRHDLGLLKQVKQLLLAPFLSATLNNNAALIVACSSHAAQNWRLWYILYMHVLLYVFMNAHVHCYILVHCVFRCQSNARFRTIYKAFTFSFSLFLRLPMIAFPVNGGGEVVNLLKRFRPCGRLVGTVHVSK